MADITDWGATSGQPSGAAIQQAINDLASSGGGLLHFPPGDWNVDDIQPRVTGSGITLTGVPGRSVLSSNAEHASFSLLTIGFGGGPLLTDCHVRDLAFKFNAPQVRTAAATVRVSRARDGSISGCRILNGHGTGLLINRAERFIVARNLVRDTLGDGILLDNGSDPSGDVGVEDIHVTDNTVIDTGDDAIAVVTRWSGGDPNRLPSRRLSIAGNIVTRGPTFKSGGGIGVYGASDSIVHGNVVRTVGSFGIMVVNYTNQSSRSARSIIVSTNTISCRADAASQMPGTPAAIVVGDRNATPTGSEEQAPAVDDLLVNGNRIDVNDRTGIYSETSSVRAANPGLWSARVRISDNSFTHHPGPDGAPHRAAVIKHHRDLTIVGNEWRDFPAPAELDHIAGLVYEHNIHRNVSIPALGPNITTLAA